MRMSVSPTRPARERAELAQATPTSANTKIVFVFVFLLAHSLEHFE